MNPDFPQPDPAEQDSPAEREAAYADFRELIKETLKNYSGFSDGEFELVGLISGEGKMIHVMRSKKHQPEFQVNIDQSPRGTEKPMPQIIYSCDTAGEVTKKNFLPSIPERTGDLYHDLAMAIASTKEEISNEQLERVMGVNPRATVAEIRQLRELIGSSEKSGS